MWIGFLFYIISSQALFIGLVFIISGFEESEKKLALQLCMLIYYIPFLLKNNNLKIMVQNYNNNSDYVKNQKKG